MGLTGFAPRLYKKLPAERRRALIVGAADNDGAMTRDMLHAARPDYLSVALVDDDPSRRGQGIHGLPVLGTSRKSASLVCELGVHTILIAVPSAGGSSRTDRARASH